MSSVVAVPNPDSPAIFQNSRVTLRSHADGLKCSGWSFYLFLAFHVRLHGYRLASIIERERVVGALLQRKAADIKNSRQNVGHTARNIVLRFLLLIVFQVAFFQYSLAARVVVRDRGLAAVRALFSVLQQLVRAQALAVEVRTVSYTHLR